MRLGCRSNGLNQEKQTQLDAVESLTYHSKKIGAWIPPERWDISAKRNYICEVCGESISFSDSLDSKCTVCNVVVHISCLTLSQRNQSFRNGWICDDCVDDIKDSKEHFVVLKSKRNYEEAAVLAQITISKSWRKYRHVKFYRYTLFNILKLQELARKIKRKNLITEFRQSMLRPAGLTLVKANDLAVSDSGTQSCDPYVIITVVDVGDPKSQHWSFMSTTKECTLDPEYNESFLVPGITGKQAIVITILDRDDMKDQFMGQAVLTLHHKRVWSRGGTFFLPLRPLEYHVQQNGTTRSFDMSTHPTGAVEVKYTPMTSMDQSCGYLYGPSIESVLLGFKQANIGDEAHKEFQTKKVWVVVANAKIYLFKRFGDPCKVIIELAKSNLHIIERFESFVFEFHLEGLPPFVFSAPEQRDTHRWKLSFLSAWQKARHSKFHLNSLVHELVKFKQSGGTLQEPQGSTEESTHSKRKSSTLLQNEIPFNNNRRKSSVTFSRQQLYPSYNRMNSKIPLPPIDAPTSKLSLDIPSEETFTLKAKLLSPEPTKSSSSSSSSPSKHKSQKNELKKSSSNRSISSSTTAGSTSLLSSTSEKHFSPTTTTTSTAAADLGKINSLNKSTSPVKEKKLPVKMIENVSVRRSSLPRLSLARIEIPTSQIDQWIAQTSTINPSLHLVVDL